MVDNLLCDVINLYYNNDTYTSHFKDAFYWLNVNIIAIVYYREVSVVIEIQYGVINHPKYKMLTLNWSHCIKCSSNHNTIWFSSL